MGGQGELIIFIYIYSKGLCRTLHLEHVKKNASDFQKLLKLNT